MMYDILETVSQWLAAGKSVALATVAATSGSAPRQVGAKMAVNAEMEMIGSVSGGCVEAAVVEAALQTLKDGKPQLLSFGVSDEQAWDVGLACGGRLQVWVEWLDAAWWEAMSAALCEDRPMTAITLLEGVHAGARLVLDERNVPLYVDPALGGDEVTALSRAPRRETPGLDTLLDTLTLIDVNNPRPHLVIVGGVHTSMALSSYARTLGMRVTLVDPRSAFATPERFPDVEIVHQFPAQAFANIALNRRSFIAILT
ncbi:MAG: XdhC family protein, partial [Anaerolineae bacterium]|nr:XdhC family protein [Anaerolineae bacterium]